MTINYTKRELDMCRDISRAVCPQDYRSIYTHMSSIGINRDGLNHESWVNKMTVMTTKIWEKCNEHLINQDLYEIQIDTKLKQSGV